MKIRDIDTLLIDSPSRKWTIVRVHTEEGLVGLGEATYSNKEPVVVAAIEHMKQELIGEDPARIEYLWHKIWRISSISGLWRMAGPVWMSALSGIGIAFEACRIERDCEAIGTFRNWALPHRLLSFFVLLVAL